LANPEVHEKLSLLKLAADTQNGTLNMRAAAAYLTAFDIEAHIAGMLPTYRQKRDLMLATMEAHFPSGTTWTRAHGGLFTWVTFPERLDIAAFQRDVLIPRAGVIVVPGTAFFADRPEANHARMSFSGVPEDRLVSGVRSMGALLAEALS
jgi:DNA-binding transcriptional MocR family regulator